MICFDFYGNCVSSALFFIVTDDFHVIAKSAIKVVP